MNPLEKLRETGFEGSVSPQQIRRRLGEVGVSEARQLYFPFSWHDAVAGGVDGARAGLYSKFDVSSSLEGELIKAVAPPLVDVDIRLVPSADE